MEGRMDRQADRQTDRYRETDRQTISWAIIGECDYVKIQC